LATQDIIALLQRAVSSERGLASSVILSEEAAAHLAACADGDARWALTALEAAAGEASAASGGYIDLAIAESAAGRAAVRYDKDGDQKYDTTSAWIKSMRGSDVNAALHYLSRMIEAGEDPRFIARRLVVHASEDVGMADPSALQTAIAAAHAVQLIGMPEARLALAQATIHISTAPKSNAVLVSLSEAMTDVQAGRIGEIPAHLRDAHYPGAKRLGHGKGYRYPHDEEHGVAAQQYAPEAVADRIYYRPTARGFERTLSERVQALAKLLRRR
jgi:putative ATPase